MNGRDWAEKHHERERERELEIERESRQSDTKQLRVVLNTKHGVFSWFCFISPSNVTLSLGI